MQLIVTGLGRNLKIIQLNRLILNSTQKSINVNTRYL